MAMKRPRKYQHSSVFGPCEHPPVLMLFVVVFLIAMKFMADHQKNTGNIQEEHRTYTFQYQLDSHWTHSPECRFYKDTVKKLPSVIQDTDQESVDSEDADAMVVELAREPEGIGLTIQCPEEAGDCSCILLPPVDDDIN